jgi:hypothetical protein
MENKVRKRENHYKLLKDGGISKKNTALNNGIKTLSI